MQIRFRKLVPEAKAPFRGTEGSAAFDLSAVSYSHDVKLGCHIYGTGLALEIPQGFVGLLFPRSSVVKTALILANCVGVIDSDYRGEVRVIFRDLGAAPVYEVGARVAQLMILPVPDVNYVETDELSDTVRGGGGFGSTGAFS